MGNVQQYQHLTVLLVMDLDFFPIIDPRTCPRGTAGGFLTYVSASLWGHLGLFPQGHLLKKISLKNSSAFLVFVFLKNTATTVEAYGVT